MTRERNEREAAGSIEGGLASHNAELQRWFEAFDDEADAYPKRRKGRRVGDLDWPMLLLWAIPMLAMLGLVVASIVVTIQGCAG